MDAQHWNRIYTTKREQDLSWFEELPTVSLQMLDAAGMTRDSCVIDVGGGDSHLIDSLLAKGMDCLAVLDVSAIALDRAQQRLADEAAAVMWVEADVTSDWSVKPMDLWHDRAVFHFLVRAEQRAGYRAQLERVLKLGGRAVIATFALNGPESCSGLPIVRYSPDTLATELGDNFMWEESRLYAHPTPWGSSQPFQYSCFRRIA